MTTESELDELDREYYRSKLDELSWCLPVVRAAKRLIASSPNSMMVQWHDLRRAVEAYNGREKP